MNDAHLSAFDEIEAFLAGIQAIEFTFPDIATRYAWLQATLIRFGYAKLNRHHKAGNEHHHAQIADPRRCRTNERLQ